MPSAGYMRDPWVATRRSQIREMSTAPGTAG